MAIVLILGAIPSGLAGAVTSVSGLYAVRFFIGILGATFVPCQAWTTLFFDKSVVGTANAFVGGWGNLGGGITFVIMVSLFDQLLRDGLKQHSAWRAAFAIVPVPILLFTAALVLIFGTDCPAGKWSERHTLRATAVSVAHGHQLVTDSTEETVLHAKAQDTEKEAITEVTVREVDREDQAIKPEEEKLYQSEVDVAVNERLTWKTAAAILTNPLTWLPALSYVASFGFELAIDANMSNILYKLYKSKTFGQTKSGYITSLYGLLNIWTRPSGGLIGDIVYKYWGVPGKKYWMLSVGILQGAMSIALGLYIDKFQDKGEKPSRESLSLARCYAPTFVAVAVIIGLMVLLATFNEQGCGANFALVPHCNPYSNGMMSGIVGGMGNVGGVIFAMVFRFQAKPIGKPFWICGIICMAINACLVVIPVPQK